MRTSSWRWIAVICCIYAICCLSAYMIHSEKNSCMGVPIIGEKKQIQYAEYEYVDFSPYLLFRGEPVAIDVASSTIYIAQPIEANTKLWDLQGKLEITLPQYTLYFEQSPYFDALSEAMSAGNTLKLLVSDGTSKYMSYDVALTSLPVIQMHGEITSVNDEGRDVWSGDFCIWTPNDPDSDSYTVKTSDLQWHVRGMTSSLMPKKPWKLSTKNSEGENNNISFLGLGKDDDWILNPMSLDDTKIKEKLTMDLWNEVVGLSNSSMRMSIGEYVEVIINGEYNGLYLLQRRVDRKYLELEEDDILIKGKTYVATTIEEVFDVVYSPLSEGETYKIALKIQDGSIYSWVNLDHFVDCNLLLQFASAIDNAGNKNMYFVFAYENGEYALYHIPWDTDMSYGTIWTKAGFAYDYNISMGNDSYRTEYYIYKENHREIQNQMYLRWTYLRSNILSDNNINFYIDSLVTQINWSGAYARDINRWGIYYSGNDTVEALKQYVQERASIMDTTFIQQ